MSCPYLEKGIRLSYCQASATLMVPSLYEMLSYCKTEHFQHCPLMIDLALKREDGQENIMTGTITADHIDRGKILQNGHQAVTCL